MNKSSEPPVEPERSGAAIDRGFSRQGFPGLEPEYVVVASRKLSAFPYQHIGQVKSFDADGEPITTGTGWRWSGGLVITAAHVLFGASRAECSLPDGTTVHWNSTSSDFHPGFEDEHGIARIGSPQDIAVMRLDSGLGTGLSLVLLARPDRALSIGFPGQGEPMVEHTGEVWQSGRYYGHTAHTNPGHSGCPLIVDGNVAGLHVGVIGLVRQWQPDQPIQERDGANTAIIFDQSLLDFLNTRVR